MGSKIEIEHMSTEGVNTLVSNCSLGLGLGPLLLLSNYGEIPG